jgi:copper transport protein
MRTRLRVAFVAVAIVVLALAGAPSASAHAVLVRTEPANDSVLDASPDRIVLHFSEPVETAFGSVRVYDASARRVDDGQVERPENDAVSVGIDRTLARGTYTVTWRVISGDSHPVRGAFVFHVKEPGANPAGIAADVLGSGTPGSVSALFTVARFLDFALLLLLTGGTAALLFVLRSADERLRRYLWRAVAAAAGALTLVALAAIVLQGAAAGGFGLAEAATWDVVSAVLETRFGRVLLAQAAVAAALGVVALAAARTDRRERALGMAALGLAAALVVTPAPAGHASVSGPVSFVADVAHVAAAGVWTGGLAFLVFALLLSRGERWSLASRAVPRFSTIAVGAVACLLVAGVVNGYLQVRAWSGLWETDYGVVLLVKIALVLPLLALGLYNNRYSVPRLRQGVATALERRRFLRTAGAELVLIVAVVSATALLVAEPPAKAIVAPTGPFAATAPLGDLSLNLVVDPAKAGANAVHLFLLDASGQPADVDEVQMSARLPSKSVGPLQLGLARLAAGHWTVVPPAQLAIAGDWQLRVEARRGEFELLTQNVSVPIRKD